MKKHQSTLGLIFPGNSLRIKSLKSNNEESATSSKSLLNGENGGKQSSTETSLHLPHPFEGPSRLITQN
jgi:hypothetical protein